MKRILILAILSSALLGTFGMSSADFGVYLAPQLGTGTFEDPYRSVIDNYISGTDSFTEIDNPSRHLTICLVNASAATHALINADTSVISLLPSALPDKAALKASLDTPITSFPALWRTTTKTKLEAAGISTTWLSGSNTLRDLLRYLVRVHTIAQLADGEGLSLVKQFMGQNLDITTNTVPIQIKNAARNWMQSRGLAIGWITNATTVREVVHFIIQNLGIGMLYLDTEDF